MVTKLYDNQALSVAFLDFFEARNSMVSTLFHHSIVELREFNM